MHALIEELRRQNAEQAAQIEALRAENQLLQRKVQFLLHRLFGRKSETLDPRQLLLLLGEQAPETPEDDPPEAPKPPRVRSPREHKPRLLAAPAMLSYGLVRGLNQTMPHVVLVQFAGALLGRFYFHRRFGKQWRKYIPVIGAGFSCGMGLITIFAVGINFLSKSVIKIPF